MSKITIVACHANKNNGHLSVEKDFYGNFHAPHLSLLIPALEKMGYVVEVIAWDDEIDWESKECIVMGPAWDYPKNVKQFHQLLQKLTSIKAIVINHPSTMLWNLEKNDRLSSCMACFKFQWRKILGNLLLLNRLV